MKRPPDCVCMHGRSSDSSCHTTDVIHFICTHIRKFIFPHEQIVSKAFFGMKILRIFSFLGMCARLLACVRTCMCN
jgi:hypothetical protein